MTDGELKPPCRAADARKCYIILRMKFVKWGLVGLSVTFLIGILVVGGIIFKHSRDLPTLDAIRNYTPSVLSTVYSDDDKVIAEFSSERRKTLSIDEMPQTVINAFVAAEDNDFFTHKGINPLTIMRAALKNLEAGHTVQGGSTITQQVAKQMLLSSEKKFSRKVKEMLLAFKIESEFSKKEIITLYLNQIFLGMNAYGVEAAAFTYFGKPAKELSIPETAILAGLPVAPSQDNPIKDPKAAKSRQKYVLGRMLTIGMITRSQYDDFVKEPIKIVSRRDFEMYPAPYFTEMVRRYIKNKYKDEALYGGGLKIYTTMNMQNQIAAQDAIKAGLISIDKRIGLRAPNISLPTEKQRAEYLKAQHKTLIEASHNYRLLGETGELTTPAKLEENAPLEKGKNYDAVVIGKGPAKEKTLKVQVGNRMGLIRPESYKWVFEANSEEIYKEPMIHNPFTQLKIGDVITVQFKDSKGIIDEFVLEQEPMVQGALLSYRLADGALQTMVGGYDYYVTKSEFNRALQARRQPGSTFKPIIYGAALESGLTPSTIIVDSPIVYKDMNEQTQMEKVWRPDNSTDHFYGDTTLRNALAYSRNIPTIKLLQSIKIPTAIEFARKLGIKSPLSEDLSIALGSSGITLEELTKAIGVYANKGQRLNTYFIKKVVDRNGNTLEEYKAPPVEQVTTDATAFLVTSLMKSVVEYGTGTIAKELDRPVAGKTGTTSDSKDALFVGFTPFVLTSVWTGFDEQYPLGRNETGAKAAAPIWLQYMQVATATQEKKDFEAPPSVDQVQIDAESGDVPGPRSKRRIWEYFAKGTAPGQMPGSVGLDGQFVATGTDPNHTKVVTGNSGALSNSKSSSDSDVGADDILRDEL